MKDHLRRGDVEIRLGSVVKLSDEDEEGIAKLYEARLSVHKITLRFSVTDNPMHHVLKDHDARIRPRKGGYATGQLFL